MKQKSDPFIADMMELYSIIERAKRLGYPPFSFEFRPGIVGESKLKFTYAWDRKSKKYLKVKRQ